MSASSDKRLDIFSKLETKQIQNLLSILFKTTMRGKHFVELAYNDRARYFVETLQFLKDINWVDEQSGALALTDAGTATCAVVQDDWKIRQHLAEALIAPGSPYRTDLADYIKQFSLRGSSLTYRPSLSDRLKQSPLRNFLMDINMVTHQVANDIYLLEDRAVDMYLWAINYRRSTSKDLLRSDVERKEQLGLDAENVILTYEKDRVGERLAYKVEHVAADSPFACYDIKSVTVHGGVVESRYIEVKAVPPVSYQFYWTHSEVETAQLLMGKYYLYLLPVTTNGDFDLKRILIVNNPYTSVYQNSETWQIEENVIICKKIQQI